MLSEVRADLIFTSPPYNIGSKAPRRDGYRRLGLYDPKSYGGIQSYPDSLPEQEYQRLQADFLVWASRHLADGGVLVYNHKPRRNGRLIHPAEWFLLPRVREALELKEEIVWDRGSTHNHGRKLMWPQTERLYVFVRGGDAYILDNTDELDFRSDVWHIPRASPNGHNAPFPLRLAKGVVETWSREGDLVCDPYMGSGTVGLAAARAKRRFIGSEILPKYFHLAARRLGMKVRR